MKVLVKFPDGHRNTYETDSDLKDFKACFPGAEFEVVEPVQDPTPLHAVVAKRNKFKQ